FTCVIKSAEASGKHCERMRLLHKIQLTCEEIIERNQFGIAFDEFVGLLLGWETNVKTETVCAACARLRRSHDSIAATGDHHEIVRHHLTREFLRDVVHR